MPRARAHGRPSGELRSGPAGPGKQPGKVPSPVCMNRCSADKTPPMLYKGLFGLLGGFSPVFAGFGSRAIGRPFFRIFLW
jgi:hypothetical protein